MKTDQIVDSLELSLERQKTSGVVQRESDLTMKGIKHEYSTYSLPASQCQSISVDLIEEIQLFTGSLAVGTPMDLKTPNSFAVTPPINLDLNTPSNLQSAGIFSTKGINDIHIETSEMKMMKKKVVTPKKQVVKTPKKPTVKDEII